MTTAAQIITNCLISLSIFSLSTNRAGYYYCTYRLIFGLRLEPFLSAQDRISPGSERQILQRH